MDDARTTRKGFNSFASIPPALLRDLNAGRDYPITLAEWLAMDPVEHLRAILPDLGLGAGRQAARGAALLRETEALRKARAAERSKGMGAALHRAMASHPQGEAIFERLASHPSPMARSWAAYALLADPGLTLAARLRRAKRFASDRDMAVRECAWVSVRPYVAADLARGIRSLRPWVRSRDPGVRRCAVEATRPRGVWTLHIEALKSDPAPGLSLLEPVRSDPSRYVQRPVGNWLNDASRSRPDWVRAVTRRWLRVSRTPEIEWTVRHALRTLRKRQSVP